MCLGTIAKVVEVHKDGRAVVEDHGKRQLVLEMTVSDDDITPGDWVVVQSGFALERISEQEALEAMAIRETAPPDEAGQPT
ncbi:HypC/HybG/HupF family hydrogenase formation chaperone [Demequina gelatinilytica]|uniref:HypC/HybG/HupF family hydrogenase formation chaperone n=1 Tax=Demequina gelatinilytica TaxID=1638980 RepID=UPI0007845DE4|nr:HypC/HybG/HupF family hydrogenase formation chaperone [Demequina gelatinilytica]